MRSLNRHDQFLPQNSWSSYGSQKIQCVSCLLVFPYSFPSAWNILTCIWLTCSFKTQFGYISSSFQLRGNPLSFKPIAPWTYVTCWENLIALNYLFPLICSPPIDSHLPEGKVCIFSIINLQFLVHNQPPVVLKEVCWIECRWSSQLCWVKN